MATLPPTQITTIFFDLFVHILYYYIEQGFGTGISNKEETEFLENTFGVNS